MSTETETKTTPFKKFLVGGKWDDVFQLPAFAFKLWLYYFRLEGKKREGWMKRDRIATACGMDKDTVTLWRDYLMKHGWLEIVAHHFGKGQEGLKGIPITRVRHGVIPPITRKNAGWKNLHRTGGASPVKDDLTALVVPVQHCTGGASVICTGAASHNVDIEQIKPKPYVDGAGRDFVVESGIDFGNAFETLLRASRLQLEEGAPMKPLPIKFACKKDAVRFAERACEQMPVGYEIDLASDNTLTMREVHCTFYDCRKPAGVAHDGHGQFCAEHKTARWCIVSGVGKVLGLDYKDAESRVRA